MPNTLISAQIERLASSVSGLVVAAHQGRHPFGGYDATRTLVLLNLWHPTLAAWAPVVDLLSDHVVSAGHKRAALHLLAQMCEKIPESVRPQLASIAARIARGSATAAVDIFDGRSAVGEAALLAVALDALPEAEAATRLMALLSGSSADRLMAATLARRIESSDYVGVVAALTGDVVPDVRATAAAALATRLAGGDDSVLVLQALRASLSDQGTFVPSAIASALRDVDSPSVREFRVTFSDSPSAFVRSAGART